MGSFETILTRAVSVTFSRALEFLSRPAGSRHSHVTEPQQRTLCIAARISWLLPRFERFEKRPRARYREALAAAPVDPAQRPPPIVTTGENAAR